MDDELTQEFHAGLRRAGLTVEDSRMDAMIDGFLGYRELAALLDEEPPLALEPAGLFVPTKERK